jgi:hypothetical protein
MHFHMFLAAIITYLGNTQANDFNNKVIKHITPTDTVLPYQGMLTDRMKDLA